MKEFLIPVIDDRWIYLILLKEWKDNIIDYWNYASTYEYEEETNKFTVVWDLIIEKFLLDYCSTKLWGKDKAIEELKDQHRSACWLIPVNIDWSWNSELLLRDDADKLSLIYVDEKIWSTRYIKPILKLNKKIIKFLSNWKWYTPSFLVVPYELWNSYSYHDLLTNKFTIKKNTNECEWWTIYWKNYFHCNSLTWWAEYFYIWKNVARALENYKISLLYSYEWDLFSDFDRWGLYIRYLSWDIEYTWYIYLNPKYVWVSNWITKDESDNYILFKRKKIWISLKNTIIEISKNNWLLIFSINWKDIFSIDSWWTLNINPNFKNAYYDITWSINNIYWMFRQIKWIWIFVMDNKWWITAENVNLSELAPSYIEVYNLKTNWISKYLAVWQNIDLNNFTYKFVNANNNWYNVWIKLSYNYDDWKIINDILVNKLLDTTNWNYYIWDDIVAVKNKVYVKNSLIILYQKKIYLS